ncbi:unnamed protein product [Bemisia tabaci]|uniref:Zinc finger CHCC-type domain-containing protein n=1 Tax=Bemisia tabaci TaxID=7038 RepID=A0A9P0AL09_BEMTA|nr:unnamed protein product [Bemisia tabaci]
MALSVLRKEICKQFSVKKAPIFVSRCASSDARTLPEDLPTHTGQKYDKNDYRMARFVQGIKHINPSPAIELIHNVPPEPKPDRIVSCNGGGGPLGHPKVYINLDKPGNHTCGYCGLRFYKDDHHH